MRYSRHVACYGLVHGNDIFTNTYEIPVFVACYGLVHVNDIVIYTYEIHKIHVTFYWVSAYPFM